VAEGEEGNRLKIQFLSHEKFPEVKRKYAKYAKYAPIPETQA
jgi:hypothetical protein